LLTKCLTCVFYFLAHSVPDRVKPAAPKKAARVVTMPMTCNIVAVCVLTSAGVVQQYTLPSISLADQYPEVAFPNDIDNGFFFIGTYSRNSGEESGDQAMEDTGGREATMFIYQISDSEDNTLEVRRRIGTNAAAQFTAHANSTVPLLNGMKYLYPKDFQYFSDDPIYGGIIRPLCHHFLTKDAISVYSNQFNEHIDLV
jgi:hypothetical protein